MTSVAMTPIPTPDTPMTGLTAMEPGVLGRSQGHATTGSAGLGLLMTPW